LWTLRLDITEKLPLSVVISSVHMPTARLGDMHEIAVLDKNDATVIAVPNLQYVRSGEKKAPATVTICPPPL
jgi:hypothetical protein